MQINSSTHKQLSIENCVIATLHDNGIIELEWDLNLPEITQQHLIEVKEVIQKFGNGKRMPILITTCDFQSITDDAKKYGASDEGQEFTLANAVILDNFAKILVYNFFIKFFKPKTPTKSFSTKEQAIEWLLSIPNRS